MRIWHRHNDWAEVDWDADTIGPIIVHLFELEKI
jgi:hypothetical protein